MESIKSKQKEQEEEALSQCTFKPKINKTKSTKRRRRRSTKKTIDDLYAWEKDKRAKMIDKAVKMNYDTPKKSLISKNSYKILENSSRQNSSMKIEDRLLSLEAQKQKKIKEMEKRALEGLFVPNNEKNVKKLKKGLSRNGSRSRFLKKKGAIVGAAQSRGGSRGTAGSRNLGTLDLDSVGKFKNELMCYPTALSKELAVDSFFPENDYLERGKEAAFGTVGTSAEEGSFGDFEGRKAQHPSREKLNGSFGGAPVAGKVKKRLFTTGPDSGAYFEPERLNGAVLGRDGSAKALPRIESDLIKGIYQEKDIDSLTASRDRNRSRSKGSRRSSDRNPPHPSQGPQTEANEQDFDIFDKLDEFENIEKKFGSKHNKTPEGHPEARGRHPRQPKLPKDKKKQQRLRRKKRTQMLLKPLKNLPVCSNTKNSKYKNVKAKVDTNFENASSHKGNDHDRTLKRSRSKQSGDFSAGRERSCEDEPKIEKKINFEKTSVQAKNERSEASREVLGHSRRMQIKCRSASRASNGYHSRNPSKSHSNEKSRIRRMRSNRRLNSTAARRNGRKKYSSSHDKQARNNRLANFRKKLASKFSIESSKNCLQRVSPVKVTVVEEEGDNETYQNPKNYAKKSGNKKNKKKAQKGQKTSLKTTKSKNASQKKRRKSKERSKASRKRQEAPERDMEPPSDHQPDELTQLDSLISQRLFVTEGVTDDQNPGSSDQKSPPIDIQVFSKKKKQKNKNSLKQPSRTDDESVYINIKTEECSILTPNTIVNNEELKYLESDENSDRSADGSKPVHNRLRSEVRHLNGQEAQQESIEIGGVRSKMPIKRQKSKSRRQRSRSNTASKYSKSRGRSPTGSRKSQEKTTSSSRRRRKGRRVAFLENLVQEYERNYDVSNRSYEEDTSSHLMEISDSRLDQLSTSRTNNNKNDQILGNRSGHGGLGGNLMHHHNQYNAQLNHMNHQYGPGSVTGGGCDQESGSWRNSFIRQDLSFRKHRFGASRGGEDSSLSGSRRVSESSYPPSESGHHQNNNKYRHPRRRSRASRGQKNKSNPGSQYYYDSKDNSENTSQKEYREPQEYLQMDHSQELFEGAGFTIEAVGGVPHNSLNTTRHRIDASLEELPPNYYQNRQPTTTATTTTRPSEKPTGRFNSEIYQHHLNEKDLDSSELISRLDIISNQLIMKKKRGFESRRETDSEITFKALDDSENKENYDSGRQRGGKEDRRGVNKHKERIERIKRMESLQASAERNLKNKVCKVFSSDRLNSCERRKLLSETDSMNGSLITTEMD